jgi:hypothetical protein
MKTENSTNKIHLIGNYYYTADANQYILLECGKRNKIDRKTRKVTDEIMEYEDVLGYYTTLSALIKACVTHANKTATVNGEITTLTEAIKHIDRIFSELNDKILI